MLALAQACLSSSSSGKSGCRRVGNYQELSAPSFTASLLLLVANGEPESLTLWWWFQRFVHRGRDFLGQCTQIGAHQTKHRRWFSSCKTDKFALSRKTCHCTKKAPGRTSPRSKPSLSCDVQFITGQNQHVVARVPNDLSCVIGEAFTHLDDG